MNRIESSAPKADRLIPKDNGERLTVGNLAPWTVFSWKRYGPRCYVEPRERPDWGGVPWQSLDHTPSGGVFCLPEILVWVPLNQTNPHRPAKKKPSAEARS